MFIFAASSAAWAHPGEAHVDPHHLARAWSWEPGVVIPLAITMVLYGVGWWRAAKNSHNRVPFGKCRTASFLAGWTALFIALVSPLHKLGAVLFAAHMAQHELLMLIAAPLLVMGQPLVPFLWALPMRWRTKLGSAVKVRAFSAAWRAITGALVVWIIHFVVLWSWHIPALYQATLDNEGIHALQHISFLGAALLFWWTLIHGRYGRGSYGMGLLYVFTTALHSSILGALLTFTQQVWYPLYDGRTTPWHLTAIEDQQLGGLIMWIPGGVVFIVVGLAMLAAWVGESERRMRYIEEKPAAEGGTNAA